MDLFPRETSILVKIISQTEKKKTLKVSGNGYEGKQQMKYHTFKKINEISVKAERVHGM